MQAANLLLSLQHGAPAGRGQLTRSTGEVGYLGAVKLGDDDFQRLILCRCAVILHLALHADSGFA